MIDLYSSSSSVFFESIFKKAFSNWTLLGTEELPYGEFDHGGVGLLERVLEMPFFAALPLFAGGLEDISIPFLRFRLLPF